MLKIRPYRRGDLDGFELLEEKLPLWLLYSNSSLHRAIKAGRCFVALFDDEVVAAAGFFDDAFGKANAFVMVGSGFPGLARAWVQLTNEVEGFLDYMHRQGYYRIQTSVRNDFERGHNWVLRLGFKHEGVMECYMPDGSDHALYARVRRNKS